MTKPSNKPNVPLRGWLLLSATWMLGDCTLYCNGHESGCGVWFLAALVVFVAYVRIMSTEDSPQ